MISCDTKERPFQCNLLSKQLDKLWYKRTTPPSTTRKEKSTSLWNAQFSFSRKIPRFSLPFSMKFWNEAELYFYECNKINYFIIFRFLIKQLMETVYIGLFDNLFIILRILTKQIYIFVSCISRIDIQILYHRINVN